MTKFERVGVNHLLNTTNTTELNSQFEYSCDCCCCKGRNADCDRCAIATAHSNLSAFFADKANDK